MWYCWESSSQMYLGNGNCFLRSPLVQAIIALSLEISEWEVWHLNMSHIGNATTSNCPWGSLECPFHNVLSDAGSRKHQCSGLNLVANAASSLALCKQVSVLPFFVQSMQLNTDMNMILSSKDSGHCPFRYSWICLLMSAVEAPGNTCQMNNTSLAAKFSFSTNPCSFNTSSNFVAQFLDGSGFESPTHNVESENSWTVTSSSVLLLDYSAT